MSSNAAHPLLIYPSRAHSAEHTLLVQCVQSLDSSCFLHLHEVHLFLRNISSFAVNFVQFDLKIARNMTQTVGVFFLFYQLPMPIFHTVLLFKHKPLIGFLSLLRQHFYTCIQIY